MLLPLRGVTGRVSPSARGAGVDSDLPVLPAAGSCKICFRPYVTVYCGQKASEVLNPSTARPPSSPKASFSPVHPSWGPRDPSQTRVSGLKGGFEPPDLDRPGRLPQQQGLCEARLSYRDGSPQLGGPGPEVQVVSKEPARVATSE